jgi:hypothetical protein
MIDDSSQTQIMRNANYVPKKLARGLHCQAAVINVIFMKRIVTGEMEAGGFGAHIWAKDVILALAFWSV